MASAPMHDNVYVATIAGVRVGANWTVLAVFTLLTWVLAEVVLPAGAPGYERAEHWAGALVTTILFFAGLLAHELSHAVVARRDGIPVERITLWLFGGVSWLRARPGSPGADFRIAAVGPLVSLGFAAVAGILTMALVRTGAPGLAVVMAGWLARVNLLLGLFNLIPAAPLDGGRILRAALWRRHGDQFRAAAAAARAGRALAVALMIFGVLGLTSGDGGLWLAVLGWFVLGMSRAEEADAMLRGALQGMTVADVMTRESVSAPGWLTVDDFLDDHRTTSRRSSFPIEAWDGRLAGVVTLEQLSRVPPTERADTRVRDVAWPLERVATTGPDADVTDALAGVAGAASGHAVVLDDDDRLVGIVTPADVAEVIKLSEVRRPLAGGRAR